LYKGLFYKQKENTNMGKIYGFNIQGNGYCCAEHSLMNTLLVLGIPISAKRAHSIVESSLNGEPNMTDLNAGLSKYGCTAQEVICNDEQTLRDAIDGFLDKHVPLVICTDRSNHFSLLAGKSDDNYFWIDSSGPTIVGKSTWIQIEDWVNSGDAFQRYYFIAVVPQDDKYLIRDIEELHKIYHEDNALINNWGNYLKLMLDFIGAHSTVGNTVNVTDLLDKYGENVLKLISDLHLPMDINELRYLLHAYTTVAKLHNLKVEIDENETFLWLTKTITNYALNLK
jgi:hypothetical protein